MSEGSDRLDKALDDALTSYGEASGNEGLEQRIQMRVNQRAIGARRMRLLSAAMTTAAVAGLLCWWASPRAAIQTQQAGKAAIVLMKPESRQEQKLPLRSTEGMRALAKKPRSGRRQRAEPKLAQFPSPSFVGSEERALLQLAKYRAKYTTQEWSYLGRPVAPIQITAVEIKPIE